GALLRPEPEPVAAGPAVRWSRARRRLVREQDEATRRDQGFRRPAARAWRRPRSPRWPGSGCGSDVCSTSDWSGVKKIAILGATGSIGKSTLDLIERSPDEFQVTALAAAVNA